MNSPDGRDEQEPTVLGFSSGGMSMPLACSCWSPWHVISWVISTWFYLIKLLYGCSHFRHHLGKLRRGPSNGKNKFNYLITNKIPHRKSSWKGKLVSSTRMAVLNIWQGSVGVCTDRVLIFLSLNYLWCSKDPLLSHGKLKKSGNTMRSSK